MASVIDIINAAYNINGYNFSGVAQKTPDTKNSKNGNAPKAGASVPSFGIKGREPLTQDMFEYKGQKMTRDEVKTKSYNDVYRHESAHLAAAGKYAASGIHIDFDGNGFATGGHVNVSMPRLDKNNLDETINHARTVIKSAEAPASFDELSSADRAVAAQSRAVLAQALSMKGSNKQNNQKGTGLNYMA